MTVTIDKFGRVLIPKPLRDRLGLTPGTELELRLHEAGDAPPSLELRAEGDEPVLVRENGRLVFAGKLDDPELDVVLLLRHQREERARKHAGPDEYER